MEELKKLLSKYWADTASASELQELLSQLDYEQKDIQAYLEKEFAGEMNKEQGDRGEEDARTRLMAKAVLERVNGQIDAQERGFGPIGEQERILPRKGKVLRLPLRMIGWVAAAMAGVILCFQLLNRKGVGGNRLAATTPPIAKVVAQIRQVVNKTSEAENIRLEDGSIVVLYPNSSLSYKRPFDSLRRNIDMQGKASFKVAGEVKRPFTVIAGNLATTALGTEFTVNQQSGSGRISVRLLEGKVVIRDLTKETAGNLVYLKPGEELTMDQGHDKYAVRPFVGGHDKKINNRKAHVEEISTLSFSKEPLSGVFHAIEKLYHIKIRYREKMIRKLSFTGEFFPSDSLEIVIAAICNTNDLAFEEKDGIITIISGK